MCRSTCILALLGVGNSKNGERAAQLLVVSELRDGVSFDTLDLLRDPKVAAEHIELQ
jgi:hypothetical protein